MKNHSVESLFHIVHSGPMFQPMTLTGLFPVNPSMGRYLITQEIILVSSNVHLRAKNKFKKLMTP